MSTLAIPDLSDDVDVLGAAVAYAKAGWYVLPVRHGSKHPGSVVGFGWNDKSSRDPQTIAAWFAGTDHGIALHVGRSGAVVFDVDSPSKLPDVLLDAFTVDQPPYQSTRINAPGRGHYLYAQPPGRTLGNGTGHLGGGWGEIRGANGVIIAAPSAHEAADGAYAWQTTGPVPPLPDAIGDLLHDASPAEDAVTDAALADFLTSHTRADQPHLLAAWIATYRRKIADGESRHDRALSILTGMLKEAAAGCFPAANAAAQLRAEFLAAVARPAIGKQGASRAGSQAESEWAGILAWAVGQARAADPNDTLRRLADHAPGDVRSLVAPTPSTTAIQAPAHARLEPGTYADGSAALHVAPSPAVVYMDETATPEKERTSWWPRDLEPILAGLLVELGPIHLAREDQQHLLYGAKVNGIIGESESGKTWVALLAVVQALADEVPVSYFDFEDTDTGVIGRLRTLRVDDDKIRSLFRYIGPDEALDAAATGDLTDHLDLHRPGLVILDGFNAAMTLMGLDLMSNSDATMFAQKLLRPIAATGACVLYVDHVPKSKDNDSKGGIGAQAKRAMTTGAALRAEVLLPFGRGQGGKIKLTVDKDRPGHVRGAASASRTVGTVVITPAPDDTITITIEAPDLRPIEERPAFRPTGLMEKISRHLASAPDGLSGSVIEREVQGKASAIREAVARLVEDGFIKTTPGPRNATIHTLLRSYSEAADMAGEYAATDLVPTPSHPVLDGVANGESDPVPSPRPWGVAPGEGRGHARGHEDDNEEGQFVPPAPDALDGVAAAETIRAVRARGGKPAWIDGQLIDTTTGEVIDR